MILCDNIKKDLSSRLATRATLPSGKGLKLHCIKKIWRSLLLHILTYTVCVFKVGYALFSHTAQRDSSVHVLPAAAYSISLIFSPE